MTRFLAVALATALAAVLPHAALLAQDPPSAQQQQQNAEARFRELTESMQRLHAYLAKVGNQDDIKVLRAGMTFVQEKKIDDAMAQIRALLDQQKWDLALERMQVVRKDLVQLMEVLQNRNLDLQQLLAKLEQLKGFRSDVDKLVQEQAAEKEASARTQELQEQLDAIQKAKAATDALLQAQQSLRKATNDLGIQASPDATKPLAEQEAELKARAEELGKQLDPIEKKAAELAKPADAKKDAGGKQSPPSEPKDAQPGQPKAGAAAKAAAGSMQQASSQLQENKPEPSLQDQDRAIESLQRAQKELERMADEAKRELEKLPFDEQAKKQEDTKSATDTLASKMEKAEQEGEQSDGEPTPGRKSVQQAVPKQKAAAGQLKEYKPAKQKQQDAKEDLENAREELDEAINQLRQQLQDEVLRALEERFTAMLAKQRELSAQTKTLDKTRQKTLTADGSLPASLKERIQSVAGGEQDLEVEASDALKLIEEEGTTAVFPEIVAELKSQLARVAKDCRANETGAPLQQRQREVEDTLTLLVNALRKTIETREGGQQGDPSSGSEPPLVGVAAELKMIKFLQERVNTGTKDYEKSFPEAQRGTDDAKSQSDELSGKQARVRDLTRKLATKLGKENDAQEDK